MTQRLLAPELTTLVHHVELTSAGWRERLVEQQALAALVNAADPLQTAGVQTTLLADYGVSLSPEGLERALSRLQQGGSILRLIDGRYKISEATATQLQSQIEATRLAEAALKARFVERLAKTGIDTSASDHWAHFNDKCLLPLIQELGAKTYELLSGEPSAFGEARAFQTYTGEFPVELRPDIRSAVDEFLDPSDADVRAFVLRNLHANFLMRAGSLPAATLDALAARSRQAIRISIFLDTNFLFSILDLHDNPSNEAAKELTRLVSAVRGPVNLKLYVLPITVDETRRTLSAHEERLADLQLSARLGRAAEIIEGDLSGITKRYVQAARASGRRLSARDYFAPFINTLIAVLRSRGVELYNENLDRWGTDQDVIDDIVDQQAFERRTRGDGAKSYEALRHDIVLWHFAKSKRPGALDSPLDAGFWITTVDFRFLGYDAYKYRGAVRPVPICVHPSTLIQMLQLWVPRSEELDLALFNSIRAMLPKEFDVEAERVTINILRALSRFENVDDLPEDTLTTVLVSDALRQRMRSEPDLDAQVQLVRDAIIAEVEKAKNELELQRVETARTREQLQNAEKHNQELRTALDRMQDRVHKQERIHSEASRDADAHRSTLEARIGGLETLLTELRSTEALRIEGESSRQERLKFAALAAMGLATLVVGTSLGAPIIARKLGLTALRSAVGLGSAATLLWLGVVDLAGDRFPAIRSWQPYAWLHWARKWIWSIIGALFLSVVSSYLYEALKDS